MIEIEAFARGLQQATGVTAIIRDGDIIMQPEQLDRTFFSRLLPALIDTNYKFLVNRNLEVTLFKP